MGRELIGRLGGALARVLTGGAEFACGARGERRGAHVGQHSIRGAQLVPGLLPPPLAAQPLAVDEVSTGCLTGDARLLESRDRLQIVVFGRRPCDRQRSRACFKTERPRGAAGTRTCAQTFERERRRLGVAGADGCLDELGQRNGTQRQLDRVARPLRGLLRRGVLPSSVEQHRECILTQRGLRALLGVVVVPPRGVVELGHGGSVALPRREDHAGMTNRSVAGRVGDRRRLCRQFTCAGELTADDQNVRAKAERQGKQRQRAIGPGQVDVAGGESMREVVLEDAHRHAPRQPEPRLVLVGVRPAPGGGVTQRRQGRTKQRNAFLVASDEDRGDPVHELIHLSQTLRRSRSRQHRLGDPRRIGGVPADEHCIQRVEVDLMSEREVEGLERRGRFEEHPGHPFTACQVEGDLRVQERRTRALHRIERPGFRDSEQFQGDLRRTGLVLRVSGFQRPPCPVGGFGSQLRRSLQERARRGEPAAGSRPLGRPLQLCSDLLVETQHGMRTVPRPSILVAHRVDDGCQCAVRPAAFRHRRRLVHRGPRERMAKPHPTVDIDKTRRFGRRDGVTSDSELCGRPPEGRDIARRLGGRDQQQLLRLRRQGAGAASKAVLHPERHVARLGQPESAGTMFRLPAQRQLQQGEGIAASLRDDAIAHLVIQGCVQRGGEQGSSIALAESGQSQLRQTGERARSATRLVAHGEHQRDPLGDEAPGDERHHLRGRLVQPVRILDEAEQWGLLCRFGEQIEGGKAHEETVGGGAVALAERHIEGCSLWVRKALCALQQWLAQLVQASEREVHLGFHAGRGFDPIPLSGCFLPCEAEQRRFADPGFTPHHERPASPCPRPGEERSHCVALGAPSQQIRQCRLLAGARRHSY